MSPATFPTPAPPFPPRPPGLRGQLVVVLGGSAGIGFETARRARAEGAEVIVTGRDRERLERAAAELGASERAAFDVTDAAKLEAFFRELGRPLHHVLVTAGRPRYGRLLEMDLAALRAALEEHLVVTLQVARLAPGRLEPGGTLTFMGGTGGRRPGLGLGLVPTVQGALPALVASLALELAPLRVNLVAPGFVDTPLSAELLGDGLEARRQELRATLPIRRVVGPADDADDERRQDLGHITLPLSTVDPDGHTWLLQNAIIDVNGPTSLTIAPGVQSVVTVDVPQGDYTVTLRAGWTLAIIRDDGRVVPTPAELTSRNPMPVRVEATLPSTALFQFLVGSAGGHAVPPKP